MKKYTSKRVFSLLLALIMVLGLLPATALTVRAGHTCPECQDWIDGSPYCSECYICNACNELCIECGVCVECSGYEICDGCSNEEIGDTICENCAYEKGQHCVNCDECYFEIQGWCVECGYCQGCTEMCEDCSVNLGEGMLCMECASQKESHCPECGGCYFDIQGWCMECMQCSNCSESCNYCSEEAGTVICVECAIDAGMHCPDCNECYGEVNGDKCIECDICLGCAEICDTHELCIECAIEGGYHCPTCEACGEDAAICEECGEICSSCANDFCENCNLCSECVQLCQGCGACSNCAEICENCEEYCTECQDLCDDCGLCLVCCEDNANFDGCDCSDWVCKESSDWDAHFDEYHKESESSHNARPIADWLWDEDYHFHACTYCTSSNHYTGVGRHTYVQGVCTVCKRTEDANIVILEQPKDVRGVYVSSPDEAYDDSNIAHLRVRAAANTELTYTWCIRYYVNGQITYKPLEELCDPQEGEVFDQADLYYLVPTDACCNEIYVCCIITDEEGNQVRSAEAMIQARHNYQYYSLWKTHEWSLPHVAVNTQEHNLQCVGECCDRVMSGFRPHEDDDGNKICDICDYKLSGIVITKQPKAPKNVYVCSADEAYDESNIAHFSVAAIGEGALTYTWCRKQYVNGKLTYVPLRGPLEGENYTGPNLDLLVPTDACCQEYTYACIITDTAGNEIRTVDVVLKARHNYQYFKDYLSDRENPYGGLRRQVNGHLLQCVGEGCEKVTRLRRHVEENNDFRCDVCEYISKIDLVELTITAPVEGQKPNYNITCGSRVYGSKGSMNNGRYWYVSDNGVDNWKLIDNTKTFQAGKYYKFSVDLETISGYEFDRHYDYNSKVLVTVNGGQKFFAQKTYNKDLAHYITVEYIFGECNDSVIENIVLDNVVEPVAGEKPSYSATVRGNGYVIDTAKNAQLDDYWNNPQKKPHYIKNGIGWFDMTEFDWVYEDEYFIPGHEYQVRAYLKTENGFEFAHSRYYEPNVSASINNYVAEVRLSGSNCVSRQEIDCTFTCQPQEISTLILYLDRPQAGKTPMDFMPEFGYPEIYTGDPNYGLAGSGTYWYDSQGNMIFDEDKLVEGEKYKLEIKVVPAKLEGVNVCKFSSSVAVYINGQPFEPSGDWEMVYGNSGVVYIYYSFTKGASKPAVQVLKGDCNGDGEVTNDDVVALLWHALFPEQYSIVGKGDFTGEGEVTNDDVVVLLWYALFPEQYPLG